MKDVGYITDRWNDLYTTHQSRPYHILIMGGDQVYTDGLWQQVKSIFEWNVSFALDRWHKPFTKMMKEELDLFLCNIYFNARSSSEITNAMSAIPSIMMWDDHDIFDGWGPIQQNYIIVTFIRDICLGRAIFPRVPTTVSCDE